MFVTVFLLFQDKTVQAISNTQDQNQDKKNIQNQVQNQVQNQGQGQEAMIKQALEDPRTQQFLNENYAQLKLLKNQQEEIVYTMEGFGEIPYLFDVANGGKTGVFPQMVSFFEQLTNISFQEDTNIYSRNEMLLKLELGEIDWILGPTLSEQTVNIIRTKFHELDIIPMHEELFHDPYLLIAKEKEKIYTKQTIPYHYWGCLEEQKEELIGTELEEHTVTYNSLEELEQAFVKEEIEGVLLSSGCVRYLNLLKKDYQIVDVMTIPARKYSITEKDQLVLSRLIANMTQLYLTLYEDYFQEDIKNSLAQEKNQDSLNVSIKTYILLGGIVILIIGFVFYWYRSYQLRKRIQRLLESIPNKAKPEQEIFVVYMNQLLISSSKHFQVFGLAKKYRKRTMPLAELTIRLGFDFQKHYAYQIKGNKKLANSKFELYLNGRLYQFEEAMAVSDVIIVSKVYREPK